MSGRTLYGDNMAEGCAAAGSPAVGNPVLVAGVDVNGNVASLSSSSRDGASTTAIAAGKTTDTVIKGAAGKIYRILVTTTGSNPLLVFDNATTHTGTVIGALPASPAIGSYLQMNPAANGITVQGNAANPAVTISWE
jgi:hypothetical protein